MRLISLLALFFLFTSCASSYKPIAPLSVNYTSNDEKDGIALSYRYDVLREKGNKKYAKKEIKKGIKIVAVRIVNNSDSPIIVGSSLKLFSGNSEAILIDPLIVQKELRQPVPVYLLYLLLTPVKLTISKSDNGKTETDSYPIGFGLGPGLSIINMAIAGSANKGLLSELNQFNQINKTILPGQTSYGLIGIRDVGYSPLRVEVNR